VISEGVLRVPDFERVGALPGTAMLTAIDAARSLKIPVSMTLLSPWDLTRADEAFLSGSMRELTPLVNVDGKPVGSGVPGPLTARLIKQYRAIIERACKPFKFPY
jgi:branched-subunit amino acid aminotransferase/4-amino-4-deoxychorismate lyase